jgi:hypothetical protein
VRPLLTLALTKTYQGTQAPSSHQADRHWHQAKPPAKYNMLYANISILFMN